MEHRPLLRVNIIIQWFMISRILFTISINLALIFFLLETFSSDQRPISIFPDQPQGLSVKLNRLCNHLGCPTEKVEVCKTNLSPWFRVDPP